MKKIIYGLMAMLFAVVVGCTPTAEQINKTASAIGCAVGLVANTTDINDNARNAIVTVLNDVRECIPVEGESFATTWTPIIRAKVAELVESGKIDAATGDLVASAAIMAAKGIDYMFDIRFPKARKYEELVRAGVSGAVDGFLTVFKPVNCDDCNDCSDCAERAAVKVNYDKEAFEWFKQNVK